MKKFITFQLELPEIKEENITESMIAEINQDFENNRGIYKYGPVEVVANAKNDCIVVCGKYYGSTKAQCTSYLNDVKREIKKSFNTKKVDNLFVAHGESI